MNNLAAPKDDAGVAGSGLFFFSRSRFRPVLHRIRSIGSPAAGMLEANRVNVGRDGINLPM